MIMQITAFKAILARRIYIKGCEDYKKDYKNTLYSVNFETISCKKHSKQCALDITEISRVLIGPFSPSHRIIP